MGFMYEDKIFGKSKEITIDLNKVYKNPLAEEAKRICTEWVKDCK